MRYQLLSGLIFAILISGCVKRLDEDEGPNEPLRSRRSNETSQAHLNQIIVVSNQLISSKSNRSDYGLIWRYSDPRCKINNAQLLMENDLKIGISGTDFDAEFDANLKNLKNTSVRTKKTILNKDSFGSIIVGESRFIKRLSYMGKSYSTIMYKQKLSETLLLISAKVVSKTHIKLKIYPEFTNMLPDGKSLECKSMTIDVLLPIGGVIMIGGLDSNSSSVGTILTSSGENKLQTASLLIIRAATRSN